MRPRLIGIVSNIVIAAAALLAGHAQSAGAADTESLRPATVNDVLRIEGFGVASYSPDGRWLAYNQIPPYNDLSDYSYWMYAFSLSGHQLWVKDIRRGGPPILQPGLDRAATNYLVGFSPDSAFVIVLEYSFGRLQLVACRVGKAACARQPDMPDIRDMYVAPSPRWNERLVWSSPTTIVMPTRSQNMPGSEMRNRPAAGRYLWDNWNRAWRGDGVTASEVISTGHDRSEDWATGALIEFDIRTGQTRHLAQGRYAGIRVSPDKKMLIGARVGERIRPASGSAALGRAESHPVFDRRYALTLINAESGETRQVDTPFNIDPNSLQWAPDGHRFIVYGWSRGASPRDGEFYVFDAETLTPTPYARADYILANNRLNETLSWFLGPARAMVLESGLAVFARPRDGDRYDWYLFRHADDVRNLTENLENVSGHPLYADTTAITVLAGDGIYRVHENGDRTRLTPVLHQEETIRELTYQTNAAHGWANDFRFDDRHLIRNDFDGKGTFIIRNSAESRDVAVVFLDYTSRKPAPVTLHIEQPGAKVLAANGSAHSAVISTKDGGATDLSMLIGTGASARKLARINDHLNRVAHPQTREIVYTLNDPQGRQASRETKGCLTLPPDYDETRIYPTVIEVYPISRASGCETLRDRTGIMTLAALKDLWAARGVIYFRPAIPFDFARTSDGPIAGMGELVDQAVDALVDQSFADPERIILMGVSQGGVSSLYVATQSKKYAAVISMFGWADFLSHYFGARGLMRYFHLDQNGGDNRWRYECRGEGPEHFCPFGFGVTPFEDPGPYVEMSPIRHADKISAPVLLLHGDLDYFDIAQYDEMFGALYRAGKEARYVRYWGEGHTPSSPDNVRDVWDRIDQFLAEHKILNGNPAGGSDAGDND